MSTTTMQYRAALGLASGGRSEAAHGPLMHSSNLSLLQQEFHAQLSGDGLLSGAFHPI